MTQSAQKVAAPSNGGAGVIFRNIHIEDPRPTLQQFFLCMTVPKPYSKDAEKGAAGDLADILFQFVDWLIFVP